MLRLSRSRASAVGRGLAQRAHAVRPATAASHRVLSTAIVHLDDEDDACWSSFQHRWVGSGQLFTKANETQRLDLFSGASEAAALAMPTLERGSGVHRLAFSVQGDCVVGVASAVIAEDDEWSARAWGVGTASGCLHLARSASEDGMLGVELGPQRMANDADEKLVEFEIDMDALSMRLRFDEGRWRDMPVGLPEQVRPWALIPAVSEDCNVSPIVRIVSCEAQ